MNGQINSQKNPIIAGILSAIFPGLGQFYNEDIGKGLLVLFGILGTIFLVIVGHVVPWDQFPFPFSRFHHRSVLDQLFPLFAFFVIIPMVYIFGIVDAVVSARRISQPNMGFYGAPQPTPQPHQPSAPHTAFASQVSPMPPATSAPAFQHPHSFQNQETLRQEAQIKMNTNTNFQAPPNINPMPEASSVPVKEKGTSGKFVLAIVLVVVGFIVTLDQFHFAYITFERLWPLIPLVFGLRLLKDYQMEKEGGQLVLGSLFSGVGFIFLMQNWGFASPVDWLFDHFGLLILGFGGLLIWQEMKERKHCKK